MLRRHRLKNGARAPFALDPEYLLTVLKLLPKSERAVVHVEAGKVGGKSVAIRTCHLTEELAEQFAQSGAVPDIQSGFGGFTIAGLRGDQYKALLRVR